MKIEQLSLILIIINTRVCKNDTTTKMQLGVIAQQSIS